MAEKPENSDSGGIAKLFENFCHCLELIYMVYVFLDEYGVRSFSMLVRQFYMVHIVFPFLSYLNLSVRLHFAQTEILFARLGGNALGILTCAFFRIILRL